MKIVEPKYEILTDISEGGIKELQQIERVARVCYKSEDKITPDGESAKKLVGFLVKQGHEAMLEHSQLSVLFTCDRAIANELVRHRIASFAQESTRYCNYSKEKFEGSITVVEPFYIDKEQNRLFYRKWVESCELAEKTYFFDAYERLSSRTGSLRAAVVPEDRDSGYGQLQRVAQHLQTAYSCGGPSSDERADVPAAEGTAEQDPGGVR